MDDLRHERYQKENFERFEDMCIRCGECCSAADGDPCVNLAEDGIAGKYYCKIYKDRLGPQKTRSGKIFICVTIREIIKWEALGRNCAYNKISG